MLVRPLEDPTFEVAVYSATLAAGRHLLSLWNATGGASALRVHSLSLVNVQTASVAGQVAQFGLLRATSATPHSGGTDISGEASPSAGGTQPRDSASPKGAWWSARTGSTVSGVSPVALKRLFWSTDEWGTGTLDVEANDHAIQTALPVWGKGGDSCAPIILRQGEGLTVRCVSGTVGAWDVYAVVSEAS